MKLVKQKIIWLSIILVTNLFINYQSYSKSILNDTLFVVKYKNVNGVFIDSTRLLKITNKIILADSLKKINELQNEIISYNAEQLVNKNVEIDVYKLYIESEKQKQLLLNKKSKWNNIKTYSIYIILLTLYLLK